MVLFYINNILIFILIIYLILSIINIAGRNWILIYFFFLINNYMHFYYVLSVLKRNNIYNWLEILPSNTFTTIIIYALTVDLSNCAVVGCGNWGNAESVIDTKYFCLQGKNSWPRLMSCFAPIFFFSRLTVARRLIIRA